MPATCLDELLRAISLEANFHIFYSKRPWRQEWLRINEARERYDWTKDFMKDAQEMIDHFKKEFAATDGEAT